MKRILSLILGFIFGAFVVKAQIVFSENFSGEADGDQTGIATPAVPWSVLTTPTGGAASFSKQTHIFGVEIFQVNQTGALSEGAWQTDVINLGTPSELILSATMYTAGASGSDYIRCYYKADGGPEVLFGSLAGSFLNASSPASAVVNATTIQIIIRGRENTGGNFPFTSDPNAMGFDDVSIEQVQARYSITSGDWNNGATWSTTGLNGSPCGCTPNDRTNVVIGDNDVVSITAAANAISVTVQNTATLRWTTDNVALNINRGGDVSVMSSAQINRNSNNGARIEIEWDGVTSNIAVDGTLNIGDLVFNAAVTSNISGSGTLTIGDDFLVNDVATITNNMTGTLAIGDALTINGGAASFTNNGPTTIGGITSITSPSIFSNNNTVTISSQSVGALAGTGTWTQGNNSMLNYAGSTLTINTFNASNAGNTVNYNRTRSATIRNPSASTYHHLGIAGTLSGAKVSSANHIVNGNLSITGSATTLDPLNFDFTVNGTSTITVTGGGFNDSDNAGVNTFVGNVNIGGGASFVSNSVATTANLVFMGGIANAGTFTAGGATFNTNDQALTGVGAMSFANNVVINTVALTNANTGAFTITGTTTLQNNSDYIDTDNTSVSTFVGLVSQSGGTAIFNTTAVTTPSNLIFRGGITNSGGTFTAGGATFNTNAQAIAGSSAISFANPVIVTGVTVTNNNTAGVSITSTGASLSGTGNWTQGTNGILNYGGSTLTVNTFDANTNAGNTVNYNSIAAGQTVRVPSASTYQNLTFNNTSATPPQLTAGGNISVSGILTMTSGRLDLNTNTLTLTSNAAGALVHGLTSANGWMFGGTITRAFAGGAAIAVGNVRGFFPLGSATDWRPFFVGVNNTIGAGNVSVSHTNAVTTSVVSIPDPGPPTIVLRHDAFWTVARTVTGGGTSWALRAGGENFGTIAAGAADIRMLTPSAVVGTHAAGSGGPTDWRVNRTGLSRAQFNGRFHLGSTNAITSPLPIKLLYFQADIKSDEVELQWATAQEINNDFFTIEKSANPEMGFEHLIQVKGEGNSSTQQEYIAVDKTPWAGLSYYRLKQTDFDGKFTYSKLVSVYYEGSSLPSFSVYPNPLKNNQSIKVELSGLKDLKEVPVVIYNSMGQTILEKTIAIDQSGRAQEEFFFEKPLTPGVFVVKAGPTLQLTQRLVVE